MHMRDFRHEDISPMVDLLSLCNKTDVLAMHMYNCAARYPTSYRFGNYLHVREMTHKFGGVTKVIETEPSDYPEGEKHRAPEVVAFALWTRMGRSDKAKEWQRPSNTWSAKLERALLTVEDRYYKIFPNLNIAFDGPAYHRILPHLMGSWDEEIFKEAWELDLLNVHPKWQGKGYSKPLIGWGLEQAQAEKVPALVKSSPIGGRAYRARGFKSIKQVDLTAFMDIYRFGGEMPAVWVWEPTLEEGDGVEGKWHERSLEWVRKQEEEKLKKEAKL